VVLERVDGELLEFERRYGALRPHVLSETWQVPPWWFVAFEPGERVLVITPDARSLRYRTAMSRARRRLARALDTLRRTVDGAVVERVEELGRWLEEFHPHAVLELDYGGLVELWDDSELRGDVSVADVQEALIGLAEGDPEVARAAYQRLSERWRSLAERSNAS
jgi:hypothetical protein